MKSNLIIKRASYIFSVILIAALLLFISAGTLNFWKAWFFIGLITIPTLVTILYFSFSKSRILEINIDFKGIFKANLKKIIIFSIIVVTGLIFAGINLRFNWTQLPEWIVIQFSIIFILAFALFIISCKEYKILSRHLFERRRKKLIDQGPYSIVRHPMYTALILICLSVPVILGSIINLGIYSTIAIYLIIKIYTEEKNLKQELKDYDEYKERVKYKMIPYIW